MSEAKIKAGVFVGLEEKRLINYSYFTEMLSEVEQTAWAYFVSVVNEFLGKHKAEKYRELVDGLVDAYQMMGCRKLLKVGLHVLHACLKKIQT